jgi:hypothetical protein
MNRFFHLIVILISLSVAFAEDYKDYAKSVLGSNPNPVGSFNLNDIPNYNANPKEANYEVGSFNERTREEVRNSDVAQTVNDNFEKSDKRFSKFVDESWAKKSLEITSNPLERLKNYDVNCQHKKADIDTAVNLKDYQVTEKQTISKLETQTCEEPGEKIFECDRKLHLKCKKSDDCDNGGVIAASVVSDMKWEYQYPFLIIGTIADNYWGGHCAIYDRITKFEIRNKEKLTEFRIVQVGFDDYMWIKVNGHTVYVGPDGGQYIEVINGAVENGHGRRRCERMTNWNNGVDIDLKPYLKDGQNEIFMRVVVAGNGEGWMKIRARQHCCKEWIETWETGCEKELETS